MIWTILEIICFITFWAYLYLSQREIRRLKRENLVLKADETLYQEKANDEFHIFKNMYSAEDDTIYGIEYILKIDYTSPEKVTIKRIKQYKEPMKVEAAIDPNTENLFETK